MKKLYFCFIFLIFVFVACKTSPYKVQTVFEDYDEFCTNMKNWVEPKNYSFTYNYSFGDTYVLAPITVTISDGVATVDYGENVQTENDEYYFLINYSDYIFKSITEIYKHFDDRYKYESENNTDYEINYRVKYEVTEKYGNYPKLLDEDMVDVEHYDWVGYGGTYIKISDFKVNE